MANEWQMPRRSDQCVACGTHFEVGQTIHVGLYESAEGYERRDFCTGCEPPTDPAPLGIWRTQRRQPAQPKGQPFDPQATLAFFERLDDADTPERLQFRFVLALLLWRKKVLKLVDSHSTDDGEVWRFSMPGSGNTHEVFRPEIDEEQVERLSEQLELLLAGESSELQPIAEISDSDSEPLDE